MTPYITLTSDMDWDGNRAFRDKERLFVLVTIPGRAGVAVAYGSAAELPRLQFLYDTLKHAFDSELQKKGD